MNKEDKRYVKNHQLILNNFCQTLQKEKLSKITIDYFCQQCLISKTTFYSHFNSKEELILEVENDLLNQIQSNFQESIKQDPSINTTNEVLNWLIGHVKNNKEWFYTLFLNDDEFNFSSKLTYNITKNLSKEYEKAGLNNNPVSYTALYYGTNGLVLLIKNWVLGNINDQQLKIIFDEIHSEVCTKIYSLFTSNQ